MDPVATLQAILDCIVASHQAIGIEDKEMERDDLIAHLENLLVWLKNGGFIPLLPDKYTLAVQTRPQNLSQCLTRP